MALSPHMLEVVETQMLCNLKNFLTSAEPVTCDIQEILSDAGCFYAVNSHTLRAIRVQLLCDISNLL